MGDLVNSSLKDRLREAYLDLVTDHSCATVGVSDLISHAHVSRSSFYRHYASIDDLLASIRDDFLEGARSCARYYVSAPLALDNLDEPHPAFVSLAYYLRKHQRVYLALSGAGGDEAFRHGWRELSREYYAAKLAFERLMKGDCDMYIEYALGGMESVNRYWLAERPDITPEEAAVIVQKALYAPFARKGKL